MASLNLFPARVAFVNPDGTLTNEAYRALQIVFSRIGGALGDSGADVFGQVFGVTSEANSAVQNDVTQPASFQTDFYADVVQVPASSKNLTGFIYPDVTQPTNDTIGVFQTLAVTGNATVGGTLTTSGGATLQTTSTALTDGAGVALGTITNAPAAGNPTKWIGVNDNGVTRFIPSW